MTVRPRLAKTLIRRPRLLTALRTASPVTVLRAPVGFGKTTLVTRWAGEAPAGETVLWVRIRPGAGDAPSFWAGVVDALTDAGIPLPPLHQYRSPQALAERMLTHAGRPMVVVADGFENVTGPEVDETLIDLVWHTPELRLIACLRSHWHFPVHLLGEVDTTVITARDLRFTLDETASLLTALDVPVSADGVEGMQSVLGGWPEPTRIAALAAHDAHKTGSRADLPGLASSVAVTYLNRRLISQVTGQDRIRFAMTTALPANFSVPLAELLSGDEDAKVHLQWLEGEGVLIAQDEDVEGTTYRWPAGARGALLAELRRTEPAMLPELHDRLASWYLDRGNAGSALHHAVQSRRWPRVIEVIDAAWRDLLFLHHEELFKALAATPLDVIATSPRAAAVRDLRLEVPDDLLLTVAAFPAVPDFNAPGADRQAAEAVDVGLAVIGALRRRARFEDARRYCDRLLEIAERARRRNPAAVAADIPVTQLNAGLVRLLMGDMRGAQMPLRLAHELADDNPRAYIAADAAGKLALAHAALGEVEQAELWLSHYRSAPLPETWIASMIEVTATAAALLTALDRLDLQRAALAYQALRVPDRIEEFWAFLHYARAQYVLTAGTGSAVAMLDELHQARAEHDRWLTRESVAGPLPASAEADLLLLLGRGHQANSVLCNELSDHELLRVGKARLALLTGDAIGAAWLSADSSWDRVATARHRLEMTVIGAVAHHRIGDRSSAVEALQRAIEVAEATGSWRALTMVPRADLSAIADARPELAQALSRAPLSGVQDVFPSEIALIQLTQREHRVLEKLAQGRTLQQAADEFVLSYNTIKSQVRSLYRKLGTESRSDAIARARRWGLLEPQQ